MRPYIRYLLLVPLAVATLALAADPSKQTVCTITVNSADERESFRRNLSPEQFDFVELVDGTHPDWLGAACRKGVHCDVLLISGHFDDGSEFYSDKLDSRDHLPVAELERAACTEACSGLFAQLKEVYLFGCNTLSAERVADGIRRGGAQSCASGSFAGGRGGLARILEAKHGESNRDRMRVVFKDVPVIYGFSAKAPLGVHAAPLLERWFKAGGAADVAQGRASARLVGLFAPASMQMAAGVTASDPLAGHRNDVCSFADDTQSAAERVSFVHTLLQRDTAESQMYLARLEALTQTLAGAMDDGADATRARASLASDANARRRFLDLANDADELATLWRMLDVARRIGWMSSDAQRTEFVARVDERASRSALNAADVETVCTANARHELDAAASKLRAPATGTAMDAAAFACLGRDEARARVMRALTSNDERDAQGAQVYLRHRPVDDVGEIRALAMAISRMPPGAAQVRALDSLAAMRVSDPESLTTLTTLYPRARSLRVQRAIAGVLIRADTRTLANAQLAQALRRHRIPSPDGEDLIDVLIRRLQTDS